MTNLEQKYRKEVAPRMMEKFKYKSKMAIPKITKVTINTGFGRMVSGKTPGEQKPIQEVIMNDLATIAGQKPTLRKTKKSIATFKTREGMILGAAVILRNTRMYDFLERLISIALPRTRDFQGLSRGLFDQRGNLNIGIKEHVIFPEILPEKVKTSFGLEITVTTTAKSKEEGIELLTLLGFPIKSE